MLNSNRFCSIFITLIIFIFPNQIIKAQEESKQIILKPFEEPVKITNEELSRLPTIQQIQENFNNNKLNRKLTKEEIKQLNQHLKTHDQIKLIKWIDGHQELITEGEKTLILLKEGKRKFVDITDWTKITNKQEEHDNSRISFDFDQLSFLKNQELIKSDFPSKINIGLKFVKEFLDQIKIERMKSRLTKFTSFRTRYYHSSTGRESQVWLLDLIKSIVKQSSSNVTVSEFKHPWGQNSIIARFEAHPDSNITNIKDTSTFIIGSHQDSTNLLPFLSAPGADDDGSGTISILEAFTILTLNGWKPKPNLGSIEFMWYSAEEGGLLGSQAISKSYDDQNRLIKGMVQFDMTAFVKKGTTPNIGLVTDFVDPALTQYLRLIIDEYCSIDWINTKCGYACSDHASWLKINVPSSFAIESTFENSNQKIHSINDRFDFDEFSFDHMAEFSKLVLGLVFEIGGI